MSCSARASGRRAHRLRQRARRMARGRRRARAALDAHRSRDVGGASVACRTRLRHLRRCGGRISARARRARSPASRAATWQRPPQILGERIERSPTTAWNGVGQSVTATQTDRAISLLYALTGSYGGQGGNVPGGAATVRRHLGPGSALARAARQGAGPRRAPARARPHGLGHGARRLPRRARRRALSRAHARLVRHQPAGVAARHGIGRSARWRRSNSTSTPISSSTPPRAMPTSCCPSPPHGSAKACAPASTSASMACAACSCAPAVIAPIGEARSDTDIVLGLARRLGLETRSSAATPTAATTPCWRRPACRSPQLRADARRHRGRLRRATLEPTPRRRPTARRAASPTPTRRIEIYSERLLEHGYPPVPGARSRTDCLDQARRRLSAAARAAAKTRRLLPQPAPQHRLAAPPRARSDAWRCRPPTAAARGDRRGRLGAHHARRRGARRRPRAARRRASPPAPSFGQHGWWVRGPGRQPLRRPPSARRQHQPRHRHRASADPVSGSIPLRASWCNVEKLEAAAASDRAKS